MSVENARRPPRSMPHLRDIAEYWVDREDDLPSYQAHSIGLGEPFCAACGWLAPVPDGLGRKSWALASRFLDRAHLVDRALGGLDHEGNIVVLCHLCHRRMPSFDVDQWADAVAWVEEQRPCHWGWQLFTDEIDDPGTLDFVHTYPMWLEALNRALVEALAERATEVAA